MQKCDIQRCENTDSYQHEAPPCDVKTRTRRSWNNDMNALVRVTDDLDCNHKQVGLQKGIWTYKKYRHKEENVSHGRSRPVKPPVEEERETNAQYSREAIRTISGVATRNVPVRRSGPQGIICAMQNERLPHHHSYNATKECAEYTSDETKHSISSKSRNRQLPHDTVKKRHP